MSHSNGSSFVRKCSFAMIAALLGAVSGVLGGPSLPRTKMPFPLLSIGKLTAASQLGHRFGYQLLIGHTCAHTDTHTTTTTMNTDTSTSNPSSIHRSTTRSPALAGNQAQIVHRGQLPVAAQPTMRGRFTLATSVPALLSRA